MHSQRWYTTVQSVARAWKFGLSTGIGRRRRAYAKVHAHLFEVAAHVTLVPDILLI